MGSVPSPGSVKSICRFPCDMQASFGTRRGKRKRKGGKRGVEMGKKRGNEKGEGGRGREGK